MVVGSSNNTYDQYQSFEDHIAENIQTKEENIESDKNIKRNENGYTDVYPVIDTRENTEESEESKVNNRFNDLDKIENKINNYVTDVHWKVSKYLVLNYDHIVIGNLSTSNIKKKYKHDGNLQIMKCLNMYTFRERIKYRCLKYNKKYFRVNEAYTTKCCSNCATMNDIGQSKIYTCTNCNLTYDRDIKSAGCIYMKALK